ncbi:MAG: ATP-dependent DNA helicase RecG [Chloroflexota bacterium]
MKSSLEKLLRVFKHESDLGYEDRAVMGGLEKLLSFWENDARADQLPDDLIEAVSGRLKDYRRLSPASRKDVLLGVTRRIQRFGSGETSDEEKTEQPEKTLLKTEPVEVPRYSSGQKLKKDIPEGEPVALNAPVSVIKGIGPAHAKILNYLGIHTLKDMLYYFPRRYDDYATLKPINRLCYGEDVTIIGTVQNISTRAAKTGMKVTEALVGDGSGTLRVTWFNQPWKANQIQAGMQVVLSGKVEQYLGRLVMNGPECESLDHKQLHTNRIVPIYSLAGEIKQRKLRTLMDQVVSYWAPRIPDPLPEKILQDANLMNLSTALFQSHFPDSSEALKAARHRLGFDEIFMLQLGVLNQKRAWQSRDAAIFQVTDEWIQSELQELPFELTGAQQRSLEDIRSDLVSGKPMNRLLQGDVGSGKTILAGLAMGLVIQHGAQAALMAPTSILAAQHYRTMLRLFSDSKNLKDTSIRLLIGATTEAEKQEIRSGLQDGTINLVIGTHALLEDPVQFENLQIVVVDEQHRFGVEQRAKLRKKGNNPHLLVMTATPIPRSLALTVYGDLDLTVIDELPPGRQKIDTYVLYPSDRERAYNLILSQVEQGRQVFIIYPLVEESENLDVKASVEEHERLQKEIFPKLKIGLVHGRMRQDEKDEAMTLFIHGEYQILVSTSVIEVGVDIPNATVMLIEGANRFGLSQLHQFRGRVGRGSEKSYCLLIPQNADKAENERLAAMVETNDGFILAERDLEQRGPGDFLGTRQSGFVDLKMANLTDVRLIEKARNQAQFLFQRDPDLSLPEHQLLAEAFKNFWGVYGSGDVS